MAGSCKNCGASMPDVALFCADCGAPLSDEKDTPQTEIYRLNLRTRIAAAASYFTVVPAILWLFLHPFRRESFVRFHAVQSIVFAAAAIVMGIALRALWIPLLLVPGGLLIAIIVTVAVIVGWSVLWAVVIIKAGQGARFRLPLVGMMAERIASARS